ncbi:PqqD family protein [Pelagerythrobacter sp.]|uniref:PqqD family protein n=1 Tax=Pelagerythrobacter sp. TaxID=2800702 RepID=UPI0035B47CE9
MKAVIEADTVLRRKRDLVESAMDEETVMLDIESGHYFGLSGVGPRLWTLLEEDRRAGVLVDRVREEFTATPEDDVRADVMAFLQQLLDKGLVKVVR